MATLEATFDPADKSTPGHYGPSQTALLLLDFHDMFVRKLAGPKGAETLHVAAGMRAWAKKQGIPVIHALIDLDRPSFPTAKGGKHLAATVESMKTGGGGEESAELLEGSDDSDITFNRRVGYVSALKSEGLEEFLKKKGITSLILTGLSTSGCVARTAFSACDAEYVVTVISDACADAGEGVHDIMVGKVLGNRGYVTTAADFQEWFGKTVDGK